MFIDKQILQICLPKLTWFHLRTLLQASDENACLWYMNEPAKADCYSSIYFQITMHSV